MADEERIRSVLQAALPGTGEPADDALVQAVAGCIGRDHEPEYASELSVPATTAAPPSPPAAATHPTYLAEAMHIRVGAGAHSFTGDVPMVRVPLPSDLSEYPIRTSLGEVQRNDHRLPTRKSIGGPGSMYENHIPNAPEKVDLITPARFEDARFGALSLYLCYHRASSTRPDYYVLEAGTARGLAVRLFPVFTMGGRANGRCGYKPTPFSGETDRYRGWLTMSDTDPDEPKEVEIQVARSGRTRTVVRIGFKRQSNIFRHPADLMWEAAMRVGLIGKALNINPYDIPVIGGAIWTAFAAIADRKYTWWFKPQP